ncbi:MAG: hypothetical protein ACREYD_07515 [Casimicrobiaceae bacterium]
MPKTNDRTNGRMLGLRRSSAGYLLFALATAVVISVAWYVLLRLYTENFGLALSPDQAVWGAFGEYVGGILNPILGTLILLGLLYALGLQRDLLVESRRAERSQRLLNQQQSFESVFFHMLDAINTRATQAVMSVMAPDLQSQRTVNGPKAFAMFIRLFGAQILLKVKRGDYYGRDDNDVLREKAREFVKTYDHAIGPLLRSMADLLLFLADFDMRFSQPNEAPSTNGRTAGPTLQRPAFYARLAMNARTRDEMKVFAIYVGSGLAPKEVARIAHAYRVFGVIEPEWWGRQAFLKR